MIGSVITVVWLMSDPPQAHQEGNGIATDTSEPASLEDPHGITSRSPARSGSPSRRPVTLDPTPQLGPEDQNEPSLFGRVLRHGVPVGGVTVRAHRYLDRTPSPPLTASFSAGQVEKTNTEGWFHFDHLTANLYKIWVFERGSLLSIVEVDIHPNRTTERDIAVSHTGDLDGQIVTPPGYEHRGSVMAVPATLHPPDKPLSISHTDLMRALGRRGEKVREDGTFSIPRCTVGKNLVILWLEGVAPRLPAQGAFLTSPIAHITLGEVTVAETTTTKAVFRPTGRLPGHLSLSVEAGDGQPLGNLTLHLKPNDQTQFATLGPMSSLAIPSPLLATRFGPLLPGTYRMFLSSDDEDWTYEHSTDVRVLPAQSTPVRVYFKDRRLLAKRN